MEDFKLDLDDVRQLYSYYTRIKIVCDEKEVFIKITQEENDALMAGKLENKVIIQNVSGLAPGKLTGLLIYINDVKSLKKAAEIELIPKKVLSDNNILYDLVFTSVFRKYQETKTVRYKINFSVNTRIYLGALRQNKSFVKNELLKFINFVNTSLPEKKQNLEKILKLVSIENNLEVGIRAIDGNIIDLFSKLGTCQILYLDEPLEDSNFSRITRPEGNFLFYTKELYYFNENEKLVQKRVIAREVGNDNVLKVKSEKYFMDKIKQIISIPLFYKINNTSIPYAVLILKNNSDEELLNDDVLEYLKIIRLFHETYFSHKILSKKFRIMDYDDNKNIRIKFTTKNKAEFLLFEKALARKRTIQYLEFSIENKSYIITGKDIHIKNVRVSTKNNIGLNIVLGFLMIKDPKEAKKIDNLFNYIKYSNDRKI